MKTKLIAISTLLSLLAVFTGFTGCASEPVTTTQTTTHRSVTSTPEFTPMTSQTTTTRNY